MISHENLKRLFSYSPTTGQFTRLTGLKAGTVAGSLTDRGYVDIYIAGKHYRAHRLAWLYTYGKFPPDEMDIDHINGNRADNRIDNLRLATRSQNLSNSKRYSNNKAGLKGVSKDSRRKGWNAYIWVNGCKRYLGAHETPEAAHAAYCKAAAELRGEFANAGGAAMAVQGRDGVA